MIVNFDLGGKGKDKSAPEGAEYTVDVLVHSKMERVPGVMTNLGSVVLTWRWMKT